MGLQPTRGHENRRRPRESGDPLSSQWIPAFAGMTQRARFSGEPNNPYAGATRHRRIAPQSLDSPLGLAECNIPPVPFNSGT